MKRSFVPVISLIVLFLTSLMVAIPAYAQVFACNSTGDVKESFYSNESVYVTGDVDAQPSENVDVYIVSHKTTWANGTSLAPLSLGYHIIQANSSGGLPITRLWETPDPGSYDIVADVYRDGFYNATNDSVDNTTIAGFTVSESPKPTLTVVFGDHHPSSHDIDLRETIEHNVMMQINVSASTLEDIVIQSVAITALGSGDDKEDIKVAYLIHDNNEDGKYGSGDAVTSYTNYVRDNGAGFLDIIGGFEISAGESKAFIITYTMDTSGSEDETYRFDLITISASGKYSAESSIINGLPLGSAIKTVSHESTSPTTPSDNETVNDTTTTTVPTDECETASDCQGSSCSNKLKTTYNCVYDSDYGVNVCNPDVETVECCGDADCVKGFYCLNYDCVKEQSGGMFDWLGDLGSAKAEGEQVDYTWTIISIVLVTIAVIVVFFIIKNRRREPWKSSVDYERDWEKLRRKWESQIKDDDENK